MLRATHVRRRVGARGAGFALSATLRDSVDGRDETPLRPGAPRRTQRERTRPEERGRAQRPAPVVASAILTRLANERDSLRSNDRKREAGGGRVGGAGAHRRRPLDRRRAVLRSPPTRRTPLSACTRRRVFASDAGRRRRPRERCRDRMRIGKRREIRPNFAFDGHESRNCREVCGRAKTRPGRNSSRFDRRDVRLTARARHEFQTSSSTKCRSPTTECATCVWRRTLTRRSCASSKDVSGRSSYDSRTSHFYTKLFDSSGIPHRGLRTARRRIGLRAEEEEERRGSGQFGLRSGTDEHSGQ